MITAGVYSLIFVRAMGRLAELYDPRKRLSVVSDESDNRILECAIAGEANLIISKDKHLLKLKTFQNIPIRKPKYLTYLIETQDE